ncbi:MAG: tRNA pseudouridine synthase B [Myxococcales bacterium]
MGELGGVLAVDKPPGVTSFDVVQAVRRALGVRRVGHAGTLDPFATGLLVVCVGEATKAVPFLMDGDKEYEAVVALGSETDTLDTEGVVVAEADAAHVTREAAIEAARAFVGLVEQVPPAYSAIHQGGRRLYELARAGVAVEAPSRWVRMEHITVTGFEPGRVSLRVRCGKGTYIRSLARDLGRALGTVAHLAALRRTESGAFRVAGAVSLTEVLSQGREVAGRLVPIEEALAHLPALHLDEDTAQRVGWGQRVAVSGTSDAEATRLLDPCGRLVAVGRVHGGLVEVVRGFSAAAGGDSR